MQKFIPLLQLFSHRLELIKSSNGSLSKLDRRSDIENVNVENLSDKRILIIGGQPKAGTTSLFDWLSAHPEICGSTLKETRFFLDEDYPLPSRVRFDGNNLDKYFEYFRDRNRKIFLEASPDYLYCQTPLGLKDILPNARFILIERDPVERMISTYGYFQQQEILPTTLSLEDYINGQKSGEKTSARNYAYRSLDQCRRSYIDRFLIRYDDRCMVIQFEDLKHDPKAVLREVCLFAGIPFEPISGLQLTAKNQTQASRSRLLVKIFRAFRRRISYATIKYPSVRLFLWPLSRVVKKTLYRKTAKEKIDVRSDLKAIIYEVSKS